MTAGIARMKRDGEILVIRLQEARSVINDFANTGQIFMARIEEDIE